MPGFWGRAFAAHRASMHDSLPLHLGALTAHALDTGTQRWISWCLVSPICLRDFRKAVHLRRSGALSPRTNGPALSIWGSLGLAF
ncbi:hypothetical protein BV20DRAFT_94006 [Pilatotrama ljubarskyi]|nr:hypothetical protein BV20DRAFT_94006 [Pilatotrama ljubarskyi]